MYKLLTGLSLSALLFTQVAIAAKVVVVSEFEDRTNGQSMALGKLAQDQVITLLVNLPHLEVVERAQMDKIVEEMHFSQSAYVDASTAVEFGKKAGAELVVFGSVSNATFIVETRDQMFSDDTYQIGVGRITLNVKIVDVATNVTIFSESATSEAADNGDAQIVIPMAITNAVNDLSIAFQEKFTVEGYVIAAEVEDKKYLIYLDIGTDVGIKKGRKIAIFGEDKVFIHPVTKKEKRISRVVLEAKVTSADTDYSIIKVKKKDFAKVSAGFRVRALPQKGANKSGTSPVDIGGLFKAFTN